MGVGVLGEGGLYVFGEFVNDEDEEDGDEEDEELIVYYIVSIGDVEVCEVLFWGKFFNFFFCINN